MTKPECRLSSRAGPRGGRGGIERATLGVRGDGSSTSVVPISPAPDKVRLVMASRVPQCGRGVSIHRASAAWFRLTPCRKSSRAFHPIFFQREVAYDRVTPAGCREETRQQLDFEASWPPSSSS